MSRIRKSSLFGLAAAALIASAAMASPAAAAFYAFPSLKNNNTTDQLTLGSVSWSGSYSTQIASPLAHGATSSGVLRTVLTSGYGGLTFNAYPIPGNSTDYCLFTFNISNSTGAIVAQGAVAQGTPGAVSCTKGGTNNIDFTTSAPGH